MGERRTINGFIYEKMADGQIVLVGPVSAAPSMPSAIALPVNPIEAAKDARTEARQDRTEVRQDANAGRAANAAERQATASERTASNQSYDNVMKLRSAYEAMPIVKEYRVGITQLGAAMQRPGDATGDNALIYDYAKAMDPGSVVRESEMGMAASGAPAYDAIAANLKKQFKIDGGGQLTPETRDRLKREIATKVAAMNKQYSAQRVRYAKDAESAGIDPRNVTGDHDGDVFMPQIKAYQAEQRQPDPAMESSVNKMIRQGVSFEDAQKQSGGAPISRAEYDAAVAHNKSNPGYKGGYVKATKAAPGYDQSYASQGLSGINEGIANIAGAPVDLLTGAINLGTSGINAVTNTRIPSLDNPLLGSQSIKDGMKWLGATASPTNDPGKQFVRRVGESVGSAVPFAGTAGTLARGGSALAAAAAGGVGAATARQVFPGNPYAEMAGEVAGGGLAGVGLLEMARRNATRQIEAAVPTAPQLKDQASELYRAAEARGITADPTMTQELADGFRTALAREGSISPTGRISEVYPKAKEAMQLVDDYAGQSMSPTQLQTVRKVAADGLSSKEATDRRLAGILTDTLDQWAAPIAPELPKARDIASRYLSAEKLEQARELAGARAGQFTGSGFENALRTEYRGLDRAGIKGNNRFNDDTVSAIETVSRGTPTSNLARGLGRLYPSGPVSFGLGSGLPAGLAMVASGSPTLGAATGAGMAMLGGIGRGAATNMGLKAANQAELVARNGGRLPTANVMTPEIERMINWLAASQGAQYLPQ